MKKSVFPIRIVGLVGMVVLLVLVVASPVGAFPSLFQEEPTPRPTATPAPYLQLSPMQGVAGDATTVTATGALWEPGDVTLYWDDTGGGGVELGTASANDNGSFQTTFTTPTDPAHAAVGSHRVIAVQGDDQAQATFELIEPTPTDTPTITPTASSTHTSTPKTPTPTRTPTRTPTPSPTLRPVTPMVTISPIPPTSAPAVTRRPTATRTNTPVPGTPTNTLTPSVTPTPSQTPGPGTPSATPESTPTPEGELSETGAGWGTIFAWGFALAGLLLVFRFLRVRGLPG
jgi:hypothetical protein